MDKINYWSQVAVLVFTFGLAIAAALQWWSGGKLDEARRAERAQTESRIATAEKQAAEASRKAEEERLARAPRSLTPEQRASLLAALQKGPQGAVNIVIPIGAEKHSTSQGNSTPFYKKRVGQPLKGGKPLLS